MKTDMGILQEALSKIEDHREKMSCNCEYAKKVTGICYKHDKLIVSEEHMKKLKGFFGLDGNDNI